MSYENNEAGPIAPGGSERAQSLHQGGRLPSWSSLRKIAQVRAIRSTYVWLVLVPLVAKVLGPFPESARLILFGHPFEFQFGLPFSWKIFFCSALIFSVSNMIYAIRCHGLIKEHEDFTSFVAAGKIGWHLRRYSGKSGFGPIEIDPPRSETEYLNSKNLQTPFWDLFERMDVDRGNARRFCSLGYIVGIVLLSIVALQNIIYVFRIMVS